MDDKKRLHFQLEAERQNRREMLRTCACAGFGLVLSTGGFSCHPCNSNHQQVVLDSDDFSMIAYCCLDCTKCDAYIATQSNDEQLRTKVAKEWKKKAEEFYCDGCKSDRALYNCEARKCAVSRNLPTCAHCEDFPSCEKEIWTKWPQLKEKVEAMRSKLSS